MRKPTTFPTTLLFLIISEKRLKRPYLLKAAVGIEPTSKGFAV